MGWFEPRCNKKYLVALELWKELKFFVELEAIYLLVVSVVSITSALELLFNGNMPDFVYSDG